jgi:hypothetical protein
MHGSKYVRGIELLDISKKDWNMIKWYMIKF